ncbi:hypothetical protein R1T43_09315 [Alteromonas sp. CI.11.F.A3]|uniref:AbiU2 domain-containing protein n=1 Tax=Alteromonas sp. CI.11.F.A3 TaxID=3079555 RepID=UPI00294340FB|nr:hypothetical protein [Alteromonas sp. CI.11.F.A3]WOI39203.1 hypothetical protein R1T43_09315 [Alteromonas sp. CI.11.F.A3]
MNEFYLIEKRISEIQTKIELYEELYGTEESVASLNKTFPECFAKLQEALFFEIICRISALFDPASSGNDKNLTLDYLVSISDKADSKEIHSVLESLKSDFKETGLKKIRNKLYAHNDLSAYMRKKKFATNITYKSLTSLLVKCFSFVRDLGIESGKVKPDQLIYRSTKLPKNRNGKALIDRLNNA